MKKFTCDTFGSKLDYSSYERVTWEMHTKTNQIQQVSMLNDAHTATDQQQVEKQYGVRHSDCILIQLNTTLLIVCTISFWVLASIL